MEKMKDYTFFYAEKQPETKFVVEKFNFRGAKQTTEYKEFKQFPDITSPEKFKDYIRNSPLLKITYTDLKIKEQLSETQTICYMLDVTMKMKFEGMKYCKIEYEAEEKECKGSEANKQLFYQNQALVIYTCQLLLALFFGFEALVCFIKLTTLLKGIKQKALGGIDKVAEVEIDFNYYRFMMSKEGINNLLTDKVIQDFSSWIITLRMFRPLYFVCMLGYFVQCVSAIMNIFSSLTSTEISQTQLTICGIAVFLAWMDVYTLTSLNKSAGLLSSTFMEITGQVFYFSIGVIVIFFAFVFLGLALYQKITKFSNVNRSSITIWCFMFGDAIREVVMSFIDEPLSLVFTTAVILIFTSSLSSIYVVLFISKFESHLEELEEAEEKKIKAIKKNREKQLQMDQKFLAESAISTQKLARKSVRSIGMMNQSLLATHGIEINDLAEMDDAKIQSGANLADPAKKDKIQRFYDNILKNLTIEVLTKMVTFKEKVEEIASNHQDEDIRLEALNMYKQNMKLFLLKVEHMRKRF